jgi:hypothetical protein
MKNPVAQMRVLLAELLQKVGQARTLLRSGYLRITFPSRTVLPPPGNQPAIVVRLDYDNVVPFIKSREPYAIFGAEFREHLSEMAEWCRQLAPHLEIPGISAEKQDDVSPYWYNPYFGPGDAKALYAIVQLLRPARIMEIGSGNSTKFFRRAITDGSLTATRLVSIDPYPRAEIDRLADQIIRTSLVECDLGVFSGLAANDIVFLDGSHLSFHGTDVPFFLLRVLPRLPKGVWVHLHDIYLPEEYPERIDELFYSEQYLLGAFLLGNKDWEVVLPVHFLHHQGLLREDGVSFWMRSRA